MEHGLTTQDWLALVEDLAGRLDRLAFVDCGLSQLPGDAVFFRRNPCATMNWSLLPSWRVRPAQAEGPTIINRDTVAWSRPDTWLVRDHGARFAFLKLTWETAGLELTHNRKGRRTICALPLDLTHLLRHLPDDRIPLEEGARRLRSILALTLCEVSALLGRGEGQSSSASALLWRQVRSWIAQHLSGDCDRATVARALGTSPAAISRAFRALGGPSFNAFVREERLLLAAHLLCDSQRSVAAIARVSGFSDATYLIRRFRRRFGCTPMEWRMRGLEATNNGRSL